jgi:hypothetical protein
MKNRAAFAARHDHPRLVAGAADRRMRRAIFSGLDGDDVVFLNVARPSITRRGVAGQDERDRVAGMKADDATVVGFGERNVYQTVTPYDSLKNAPAM